MVVVDDCWQLRKVGGHVFEVLLHILREFQYHGWMALLLEPQHNRLNDVQVLRTDQVEDVCEIVHRYHRVSESL